MPSSFPNEKPIRKPKKLRHEALAAERMEPVLGWIEQRWSQDERSIVAELAPCDGVLGDWLLALVQAWGEALFQNQTSSEAVRDLTGLASLGELIADPCCNPMDIQLQLIVAWMWARGRARGMTEAFLKREQAITGYTGTALRNLLEDAHPARERLAEVTRRPELWHIRPAPKVLIAHCETDRAAAIALERELVARDATMLPERVEARTGDDLAGAIDSVVRHSDHLILLWSTAAASAWTGAAWQARLSQTVQSKQSFLSIAHLGGDALPETRPVRLVMALEPDPATAADSIARMWRQDRAAETVAGRPVGPPLQLLQHEREGAMIFVASDGFTFTVPVRVSLEVPSGVYLDRLIEDLKLPLQVDYRGQSILQFEYVLAHDDRILDRRRSLGAQGATAGDVLDLMYRCVHMPAGSRPGVEGYLRPGSSMTPQERRKAERAAQNAFRSSLVAAGLAR